MADSRFEDCAPAYERGEPCVVVRQMVADLETPVSTFLKLRAACAGPCFLLESVEGGAHRGRYSMIGLEPDLIWRTRDGVAAINRQVLAGGRDFTPCPQAPLESLRALVAESAIPSQPDLPPMAAGIFGYLGYEMVRGMEALGPCEKHDPAGVPDAIMMRPTIMVVFDSVQDVLSIITPLRPLAGVSAQAAFESAQARLERIAEVLARPVPMPNESADPHLTAAAAQSNTTPARFAQMVAQAKDYIRAGDIFQVVLSQRFSAPFTLPPLSLYRALRRINPSPFLCYLDFEEFQIVCSSPEILVRLRGDTVTVRPIAGTRPRGATPEQDQALAEELLADPKERAEHLMLLDLGRNDVGRISTIGSVRVTAQFIIERYSHVMHIVSNVEGQLDPRHDAIDALVAGFPAGTVSGAPKIRAMEIIDELETDRRGIYAGCIGYFGASGDMETCIVLRTAVVKDGVMHVQAGAGIVYDSDPASEQRECENKSRALFRAAEEAVHFATRARRGQ
jgi:anthranilate synthase component 1